MFGKIGAALTVFKMGSQVADPAAWKARQVTGNMVGGLLLALVAFGKYYGWDIPIDTDDALLIGGAIVAIGNILLTWSTSRHAGIDARTVSDIPAEPATPTAGPVVATGPVLRQSIATPNQTSVLDTPIQNTVQPGGEAVDENKDLYRGGN